MGAANAGFVWPCVTMASDGDVVQTWAVPSAAGGVQSVRYLTGLSVPEAVSVEEFQRSISEFVRMVLSRLRSVGCTGTDLEGLWNLVSEDNADKDTAKMRRLEAQMGFDPDQCPESVMAEALALEKRLGMTALSELTPVFGRREEGAALGEISRLASVDGLEGNPDSILTSLVDSRSVAPPWQRAVAAARELRTRLGNLGDPINDVSLYALLGLTRSAVDEWNPSTRVEVGLAVPLEDKGLKFLPRKRHPVAKRFEFARFVGDCANGEPKRWLASTDLATSRQKFQRAFAAEFLCPIRSLDKFLGGDFSEPAIEEAGANFHVSEITVESLLANNGYITARFDSEILPYRLAA